MKLSTGHLAYAYRKFWRPSEDENNIFSPLEWGEKFGRMTADYYIKYYLNTQTYNDINFGHPLPELR